jgi:HEAT repeat protein
MRIRIWVVLFIGALVLAGCGHSLSTDELLGDLNSSEDGDRIEAVRCLQDRRAEASEVVPALTKSLKDVEVDVRRSAAIGLGYFGAEAESAVPALEEAQRDNDARVRNAAKVAIARIRDRK